jgi:hypothetical protein
MFTKANYTDPQGTTHELAIFRVRSANFRKEDSTSFNANLNEPQSASEAENTYKQSNLDYSVGFWPSQASYDAGNPFYALVNTSGNSHFNANVEGVTGYGSLGAEAAAEKHVQTLL